MCRLELGVCFYSISRTKLSLVLCCLASNRCNIYSWYGVFHCSGWDVYPCHNHSDFLAGQTCQSSGCEDKSKIVVVEKICGLDGQPNILAVVVVFGCILYCLASSFCNLYSAACTTKFLVFCDWVGAWTISRYDDYRSCGLKVCLMKEPHVFISHRFL